MKDKSIYIFQILDAITKINTFVNGLNWDMFQVDNKTQSAVIMQLTLIGEVSKKIPTEIKEQIDLPWRDIAGFRDRAIHNYFEIDLDVVWNTIQTDIEVLKERLMNYKG